MGQIQSLEEFLGLLRRRRLVIAALTVLGTVLAVLFAWSRPLVYEAVALIQVERPLVGDAAGPSGAAQRLQTIEQRLTTRENMLAVIERHGLYAGLPLGDDQKVQALRLSLRFQPVAAAAAVPGAGPQVSAMLIFARADGAELAARVANDFAQGMVDAASDGQSSRAREALAFFSGEETRLESEIRALEDEIATYRRANQALTPDIGAARRGEMVGIEDRLRELDQSLVALEGELSRLATPLRETDRRQSEALQSRIEVARAQRTALAAERDGLAAELGRMPEIERTLGIYDRRLRQLQAEFEVVTRRRTEAETAQRLEEGQQAERVTLLERAVAPEHPVTGGRRKIAAAGAVASLVLGIVAALVLDHLHPVVRSPGQMERMTGLRPVVTIPEIAGLRRPERGAITVHAAAPGTAALAGPARAALPAPRLRPVLLGALAALVALTVLAGLAAVLA